MHNEVEREAVLPGTAEEVWEALTEEERLGDWLAAGARIDLRPGGEIVAGGKLGFVEEVEAPRRLVFWWREADSDEGDSTRVELALEEVADGTRLRVVESRPLELLDARGVDLELALRSVGPPAPEMRGPMALAA